MTVRLGLIGLGNWGTKLASCLAATDGAELVTCFARSRDTRVRFAEEHACRAAASLEDMLEDPDLDAVIIATPHTTHETLVIAAADAGKHVMVEKPMTLTVAAAKRCIDAAFASGVLLHVAHYRRRLAANRVLRALIDDGTIGQIHHIEGRFHRSWGPDYVRPWRDTVEEAPAGAMTALGVHVVDNFLYFGGPIARLSARSERLGGLTPLDDITAVMVEFASGAFGTMATSLRLPFESSTAVHGTEAAAWSEQDGSTLWIQRADETTRTPVPVETVDGVAANLAAFVHSIVTGEPPETDGHVGLAVVAVLEAVTQSSRSAGAWIVVG